MFFNKLKQIISRHKNIVQNLSYLSILQIFILIAPLITYSHLNHVLGQELYGLIITAQVLVSYCSLIIDFGSNSVCARHISINRNDNDKLSEIVSSVLCIRSALCIICLFLYLIVVLIIPTYRAHLLLFVFFYGITLNEVLFPQYFFQGIEKMKYSTLINILIRIVFIALVFITVKSKDDYLWVPLLYTIGYGIGGFVALYMIFVKMRVNFTRPSIDTMKFYIKDCLAILATDLICTVKDKLNYLLLGALTGMGNVVIYDLGLKINALINKPTEIIRVAMLPYFANKRDKRQLKKIIMITLTISSLLVIIANIFLPQIVDFFINKEIVLWPIRVFSITPVLLSASLIIASNAFIAWGYNKYILHSIIITTVVYTISLITMYSLNLLDQLYSFIIIAVISYLSELIYRLIAFKRINLS